VRLRVLTDDDNVRGVAGGVELRFRRGQVGAGELQSAVDEILAELRDPESEAAAAATTAGLDAEELAATQVTVREEGQGIDPITTAILVGVATNLASQAATQLWGDVIWPLLKRRLGAQAVGDKVE
jgi:hypothetical protein